MVAGLPDEADELLARLAEAGFLERQIRHWDGKSHVEWATTVRGGALANASSSADDPRKGAMAPAGRPRTSEHLQRRPSKAHMGEPITVCGSFLDRDAVDFGDLDLQVALVNRPAEDLVETKLANARASGRSFSSLRDRLFWAEKEEWRLAHTQPDRRRRLRLILQAWL